MKLLKIIAKYILAVLPIVPNRLIIIHKLPLSIYKFVKNYIVYSNQLKDKKFKISFTDSAPCLFDRYEHGAGVTKHYFYQDLWAAKKIFEQKPKRHFDIGSRLDGFISHCLIFTKVTMLDIRPLSQDVQGLDFIQTDAMDMKNIESNSINSLSTLHAIEHFGLGRYGDPVNPDGYKLAIKEIQRVASKNIFFAVPIGVQRVVFDAHRVFDPRYIVELFDDCDLIEFSAIDDQNTLHLNIEMNNCINYDYGCGLFHFKKKNV